MDENQKLICDIMSAQTVFILAFAKAITATGLTDIDTFTRFVEEINVDTGEGANLRVEGIVDLLREHLL